MGARETYKENIERLRNERKEARNKIVQMTLEIEEILNSLATDSGNTEIPWAKMKTIAMGVRFDVNAEVYFIKVLDEEEKMVFKVYLKSGGEFGLQEHDCIEELYVVKGNLIDAENPGKVYAVGETKVWQPHELHKPICTLDSVWQATKIKVKDD